MHQPTYSLNLAPSKTVAAELSQALNTIPDGFAISGVNFELSHTSDGDNVTVHFEGPSGEGSVSIDVLEEGTEIVSDLSDQEQEFADWLLEDQVYGDMPLQALCSYHWNLAAQARIAASHGLTAIMRELASK